MAKNKVTSDANVAQKYTTPKQAEEIARDLLRVESKGIREDFIIIFGIFASLLIFLSVEIQVLQKATSFSLLVGFSFFLLGAVLAFLLGLYHVAKEKNKGISDYNNPLTYFIIACFVFAFICFAWGSRNEIKKEYNKFFAHGSIMR